MPIPFHCFESTALFLACSAVYILKDRARKRTFVFLSSARGLGFGFGLEGEGRERRGFYGG